MSSQPEPAADELQHTARHTLRRRAVDWFEKHAYEPSAIPNAVREVLGGPVMWSDDPVCTAQFTPEQRALILQAYEEIQGVYQKAGGRIQQVMTLVDGIGLMPQGTQKWAYQSEQWAALRAIGAGYAFRYAHNLPEPERAEAELTQAYYVVLSWIDFVSGGLNDAAGIYEGDADDEEHDPLS
ncbi:MAG: hypothetical protein ACT4OM_13210 [Actinomycetota bacterium]